MKTDIEFKGQGGVDLRGWHRTPDKGDGPFPTIVMTNGYSGTIKMVSSDYADVFAEAGYATIAFDNRNCGISGTGPGEVRYDFDPIMQARDFSHGVTFARSLPNVDPDRVGIWGTSYSGMTSLMAAANDRRIKCVVSQVPCISGYESLLQLVPAAARDGVLAAFDADRKATMAGEAPMVIKVCSDDPMEMCAAPGPDTFNFFQKMKAECDPDWENATTLRSLEYFWWTDVRAYMDRISPTPLLMISATEDTSTPTNIISRAFNLAGEPKRLFFISGTHYRSYTEKFAETSAAARDWFVEHL